MAYFLISDMKAIRQNARCTLSELDYQLRENFGPRSRTWLTEAFQFSSSRLRTTHHVTAVWHILAVCWCYFHKNTSIPSALPKRQLGRKLRSNQMAKLKFHHSAAIPSSGIITAKHSQRSNRPTGKRSVSSVIDHHIDSDVSHLTKWNSN